MAISLKEFTDINPPMFQDKAAPTEVTMGETSVTPSSYKLPDNVGKAGSEYLKTIGPAIEAERKAQEEKDIFASEVKGSEFAGKAKMGERMSEAYKAEKAAIEGSPEFSNLRKLEDELMDTEFIPTQDNAKDLGGLFSLIGVVGFAIGGSGKENAVQAMSAMNGMLSGYQKGRADLYKREKDIFDTKMKALQTKTLTLSNRLKQIAELHSKWWFEHQSAKTCILGSDGVGHDMVHPVDQLQGACRNAWTMITAVRGYELNKKEKLIKIRGIKRKIEDFQ